jgi:hypothetical protein
MAGFTLRIYFRRRPKETAGDLTEMVSLEAHDPVAAEKEAQHYLNGIDWQTHFAAIMDDDKSFVRFWRGEDI